MTDFRADCTINLHVEAQGRPGKHAWACTITHAKRGRILGARRFLGLVERDEAELRALLFGLRQTSRLQQEKVELAATFSCARLLEEEGFARKPSAEFRALREEARRLWQGFRLAKLGAVTPAEAVALREEAEGAYRRGRKRP